MFLYFVWLLCLPGEDQWLLNSTPQQRLSVKTTVEITETSLGEHYLQNYRRYSSTAFTRWTVMKYKLNLQMLFQLFFLFSPGSECSRSMLSVPVPWAHPPGWFKRYRQPLTHTPLTSPCCLLHRPACASVGRYWDRDFSCFFSLLLCLFVPLFFLSVCVCVCAHSHECVFAISRTEQVKWLTAYNHCLSWLSVLTLICHISHSACGLLPAQTAM